MSDVPSFTCQICGALILGERVVDPDWSERVREHRERHAELLPEPIGVLFEEWRERHPGWRCPECGADRGDGYCQECGGDRE